MKCGTKLIAQLTPQQRRRLLNEIEKDNDVFLREQCKRMRFDITNSLFKLVTISANEALGLGRDRITRMLDALYKNVSQCEDQDDFWIICERDCKKILTEKIYFQYFKDEKINLVNKGEMNNVK